MPTPVVENPTDQTRKQISRRSFLEIAGIGLAAGTAVCSAAGLLAAQKPEEVEMIYHQCGNSQQRILVAYSTLSGSTAGIAHAISERLCAGGLSVDLLPMNEVNDVSQYNGFILGSAIHNHQWMPEALDFLEKNKSVIEQYPRAYFAGCLSLSLSNPDIIKAANAFLDPAKDIVPTENGKMFAGAYFPKKRPFAYRIMLRLGFPKTGDFRNWEMINLW